MKFSRRNVVSSFVLAVLAAAGLWLPGARAQQFGGFTVPYIGGGLDTVWNGLNAYWKLEEATGAIRLDSTGNGNHLIDTSAGITQAAGLIGNGGTSAGSAQCLEIPDNASVGAGPGVSFSLSTWVKSSGTANAIIAGKWASSDNVGGQAVMDWSIGLNGGNNLVVNLHGPGFFDPGIIYGGSLNNTWQHLCVTFQAGTHVCKRYLNGAFVGTTTEIADIQRGAGSFALFNFGQVHAAGIVGSMDETGLWNRALSATEVAHLYNGGAGLAYPGSVAALTMAGQWATKVRFNGGAQPSAGSISALDTFWSGVVSDGVDGKIIALNAFAPDSLIACDTPFIQGTGFKLWVNHNFVAGDLTVNGLLGDGATKYLDTGISPSASGQTTTSAGLVLYVSVDDSTGSQEDFGCNNAATLSFTLSPHAATFHQFSCWNFNAAGADYVNAWTLPSPVAGYYSGQRTAANAIAAYFANSSNAHMTLASGSGASSGTVFATTLDVFADNLNGTAVNFSKKRLSFSAATLGMSSAQDALFYARVQTLRTALGGGFQ